MLYLEDYQAGTVTEFGGRAVDEAEIIAFATAYDPQPFHVDREAAAASNFGGIIASGWHTVSMTCRMFVDNFFNGNSLMGGLGADEVRWLKPVRPGDRLSVRCTVLETRRSASKPDRGSVKMRLETFDQTGDMVLTFTVTALMGTSPA
jgi:acyl dehydratase